MIKVFFSLGPCNHVVNIYLNFMMDHVVEQSNHGALIRCPNIPQPERHDLVVKGTLLSNKGCLLHILGSHFNLIITIETIHKGEDLMLCGVFNQNIDVRKWEIIFGARPVQISIVHRHSYLTILLRHRNHVGNPLWVRSDS